jgi:two-component system, OmpR family, sensor histidine kinase TctE
VIFDLRSLQFRLVWQLTALFAGGAFIVMASVAGKAWDAEANLDKYELERRMDELGHAVVLGPDHHLALRQPAELAALYGPPHYDFIFAVRDASGGIIAASPPEFGTLAAAWPAVTGEAVFFRLKTFGPAGQNYNGITRPAGSTSGPIAISVATAGGDDHFTRTVLKEFLFEIAWIIPVVDGIVLLVAILGLRHGLRSLHAISQAASRIGPADAGVRLPTKGLPSELKPFVGAFNQALERLDGGLELLRRFTANAAHELRTPLAALTAEIEAIEGNGRAGYLREDVARMNRLVDQLLQVARLDNVALDISANVDLNNLASGVVGQLAPLAIADRKMLALAEAPATVLVRGNPHALADALRNLVENAIGFTKPGTEVVVEVDASGRITVADYGPGVPAKSRERIFERFWRGNWGGGRPGAGLGLAIVQEIMDAHRGSVTVEENPGGGALFSLIFPAIGARGSPIGLPGIETANISAVQV